MKKNLFILLFICTSLILKSQNLSKNDVPALTLEKAIVLASDSSLAAFKAKNLYLSGYWEYRTFKAERLPSVSLTTTPVSYSNNIVKRYDYVNNIDVYKSQKTIYSEGNISINQNVDLTGGMFYVDTELGYLKNMGYSESEQYTSVPLRIGYSQKLFGYNDFKWDKKLEPLKYEKVKKQLVYNLEKIAEQTTSYFFAVASANKEYELALKNINNCDTLYRIGEERYKIGSISQSDLLTLKLNKINAQSALGNTFLYLQKCKFNLSNYLHIENSENVDVIIPEGEPNVLVDKDKAVRQALENNPIFLEQQESILSGEQALEQAIKNARFSATFSASVGYNKASDNFANAYSNPLRQDVISVGLSVPIVDWGVRKGKVNVAKRNLEAVRITAQQGILSFRQDVMSAVDEYKLRREQVKFASEARDIANQALEKSKKLFQIGKADVNVVNTTISKQMEAESNFVSALSNLWICYYTLRKLTLYDFEYSKTISTRFEDINGY